MDSLVAYAKFQQAIAQRREMRFPVVLPRWFGSRRWMSNGSVDQVTFDLFKRLIQSNRCVAVRVSQGAGILPADSTILVGDSLR